MRKQVKYFLLNQEDKSVKDRSDSELKDHVSENDIPNDTDDAYIDEVIVENLENTSTLSENFGYDHRIVHLSHKITRSSNRHV